jgi:aminoglycoside phosphotransferase family enzyme
MQSNAQECTSLRTLHHQVMLDHSLQEKVRFLASPGILGGPGDVPQMRETHMSWVFLTADRVFKLKKPVRFPYLDFSTCAAREAACRKELQLNQTLAPDTYLRLARLTRSPSGGFEIDGDGATIDWLVVMRRLPDERMLDGLLVAKSVGRAEIEQIATMLIAFYRSAPPVFLEPGAYLGRFQQQLASDRETLATPSFQIDHGRAAKIMDRLDLACSRLASGLEERAALGCIVEGHGDLRPEHVSLGPPIRVIDRLEFNRDLRLVDPFDELAFFGMECAMAGAEWAAPLLIAHAEKALPHPPAHELVRLYTALRATLRARLALAHLLDETPREPGKWAPRAERYLDQAAAALRSA